MIYYYYNNFTSTLLTSFSRSYHNIINRSKSKFIILWTIRRWRPYSIPTFILILWAPRSLYFNFTRIWFNLTNYFKWKRQKRNIWKLKYNLRNIRYWIFRVYCMSPSYIYCRTGCWYPSLLHSCYNSYCYPHRN